mgnify:CR=1 FL=1
MSSGDVPPTFRFEQTIECETPGLARPVLGGGTVHLTGTVIRRFETPL